MLYVCYIISYYGFQIRANANESEKEKERKKMLK